MSATATAQTVCTHPAHAAMSAIVDDVVKHYRTDFTEHDRAQLDAYGASNPFVWFARPMGTHMYSRDSVKFGVSAGWKGFAECVSSATKQEPGGSGWYHWNGYTFKAIPTADAARLVAKWEREATPETDAARDARHRRGGW